MPRNDGSRLRGRWSLKFDKCQGCVTTERPHENKGYCARCDSNRRYHANIDQAKAYRKAARERVKLEQPEKWAAKRAKEKVWTTANPERYRSVKSDWHRKTYSYKFPIGSKVWFQKGDFFHPGTVVSHHLDKRGKCNSVLVRVDDGSEKLFGVKRWHLLHKSVPRGGRDINLLIETKLAELRPTIRYTAIKHARSPHQTDEFEMEAIHKIVTILRRKPEAHNGYLVASVKNCMLDILRSNAARPTTSLEDIVVDFATSEPVDVVRSGVLDQAMQLLEPDELRIVELSAEGFTVNEIAEKIGKTVPATKSRLVRLRARMNERFSEELAGVA